MIEQINTAVMMVSFFADASGQGVTGLTVTMDAWRVSRVLAGNVASTQIATNASCTEVGGGLYAKVIPAVDVTSEASYAGVFKTTSNSVRDKQIPALWTVGVAGVEHLDADIADVPDAVWDEALAGHMTAGSTGEALSNAGSGGGGSGDINLDALQLITIDGLNLVPYRPMVSATLSAAITEVTVPPRATHMLVQAVAQNIYYTDDGTNPSTSNGFVLTANGSPRLIKLDEYHADNVFKFLRSASGAGLRYRYYRPE